jgi:hypothetical protein
MKRTHWIKKTEVIAYHDVLSATVREETPNKQAAAAMRADECLATLTDVVNLLWPTKRKRVPGDWAHETIGKIQKRLAFLRPETEPDGLVHMCCTECGYQDRQRPDEICGKCGKACKPVGAR